MLSFLILVILVLLFLALNQKHQEHACGRIYAALDDKLLHSCRRTTATAAVVMVLSLVLESQMAIAELVAVYSTITVKEVSHRPLAAFAAATFDHMPDKHKAAGGIGILVQLCNSLRLVFRSTIEAKSEECQLVCTWAYERGTVAFVEPLHTAECFPAPFQLQQAQIHDTAQLCK